MQIDQESEEKLRLEGERSRIEERLSGVDASLQVQCALCIGDRIAEVDASLKVHCVLVTEFLERPPFFCVHHIFLYCKYCTDSTDKSNRTVCRRRWPRGGSTTG